MPCSHDKCSNEANWRPMLEFRSRKNSETTNVRFSQLLYCNQHRQSLTIVNFLSDEGFTKMVKFLKENGKPAPVQRYTTLNWEELSPNELPICTTTIIEGLPPGTDDELPF